MRSKHRIDVNDYHKSDTRTTMYISLFVFAIFNINYWHSYSNKFNAISYEYKNRGS